MDIEILKDRSKMLSQVRSFFQNRDVIEVDCFHLLEFAQIDAHIDVMEVDTGDDIGYLHTSPEYLMKGLLSKGMPDIYQLGHVFRKKEKGKKHHPEFTMIEWYRRKVSFSDIILETISLIELFIGKQKISTISYFDALKKYAEIDSTHENYLKNILLKNKIDLASSIDNQDTLLQVIMSYLVEPHLGKEELTILVDFPASQAALSKVYEKNGTQLAKRFEIYYNSMELANGYDELTSSQEQKVRLEKENINRLSLGKKAYPISDTFISWIENLPESCGVSIGFDRLMMLRHHKKDIKEVLPNPF